jgi:phosphoribosylanthranilate isomerase
LIWQGRERDKRRLMSIQVKICGITTAEAGDAAASAGADFVGMVFFPKSPRHVDFDKASTLSAQLRGGPRLVAVFVNADDSTIAEAVAAAQPDYLQLHGSETPARTKQIASRFGLPIIKALPVTSASDLDAVNAYEEVVEHFLFDSKAPPSSERPGGHGVPFDWSVLAEIDPSLSWFLSGGLNPDNVCQAIEVSGAKMVDVSSGVEASPGLKAPEKIAEFIRVARSAASEQAP